MTAGTVLVVEHEAGTPAAWLGQWLVEEGVPLDVCRPYAGEPLPADLSRHSGLLVLGGSMDSWDDDGSPWLPATRHLVRAAEATGVPVLGLCLGHQIAATALGGRVDRNPAGPTLALLPVGWTADAGADPLLGGLLDAGRAVHWNADVVLELPAGATVLATSPDGAVQAARLGRTVWGLQFHPEVGPALLDEWVADEAVAYETLGVDVDGFVSDVHRHEDELRRSWRGLGRAFSSVVARAEAR